MIKLFKNKINTVLCVSLLVSFGTKSSNAQLCENIADKVTLAGSKIHDIYKPNRGAIDWKIPSVAAIVALWCSSIYSYEKCYLPAQKELEEFERFCEEQGVVMSHSITNDMFGNVVRDTTTMTAPNSQMKQCEFNALWKKYKELRMKASNGVTVLLRLCTVFSIMWFLINLAESA